MGSGQSCSVLCCCQDRDATASRHNHGFNDLDGATSQGNLEPAAASRARFGAAAGMTVFQPNIAHPESDTGHSVPYAPLVASAGGKVALKAPLLAVAERGGGEEDDAFSGASDERDARLAARGSGTARLRLPLVDESAAHNNHSTNRDGGLDGCIVRGGSSIIVVSDPATPQVGHCQPLPTIGLSSGTGHGNFSNAQEQRKGQQQQQSQHAVAAGTVFSEKLIFANSAQMNHVQTLIERRTKIQQRGASTVSHSHSPSSTAAPGGSSSTARNGKPAAGAGKARWRLIYTSNVHGFSFSGLRQRCQRVLARTAVAAGGEVGGGGNPGGGLADASMPAALAGGGGLPSDMPSVVLIESSTTVWLRPEDTAAMDTASAQGTTGGSGGGGGSTARSDRVSHAATAGGEEETALRPYHICIGLYFKGLPAAGCKQYYSRKEGFVFSFCVPDRSASTLAAPTEEAAEVQPQHLQQQEEVEEGLIDVIEIATDGEASPRSQTDGPRTACGSGPPDDDDDGCNNRHDGNDSDEGDIQTVERRVTQGRGGFSAVASNGNGNGTAATVAAAVGPSFVHSHSSPPPPHPTRQAELLAQSALASSLTSVSDVTATVIPPGLLRPVSRFGTWVEPQGTAAPLPGLRAASAHANQQYQRQYSSADTIGTATMQSATLVSVSSMDDSWRLVADGGNSYDNNGGGSGCQQQGHPRSDRNQSHMDSISGWSASATSEASDDSTSDARDAGVVLSGESSDGEEATDSALAPSSSFSLLVVGRNPLSDAHGGGSSTKRNRAGFLSSVFKSMKRSGKWGGVATASANNGGLDETRSNASSSQHGGSRPCPGRRGSQQRRPRRLTLTERELLRINPLLKHPRKPAGGLKKPKKLCVLITEGTLLVWLGSINRPPAIMLTHDLRRVLCHTHLPVVGDKRQMRRCVFERGALVYAAADNNDNDDAANAESPDIVDVGDGYTMSNDNTTAAAAADCSSQLSFPSLAWGASAASRHNRHHHHSDEAGVNRINSPTTVGSLVLSGAPLPPSPQESYYSTGTGVRAVTTPIAGRVAGGELLSSSGARSRRDKAGGSSGAGGHNNISSSNHRQGSGGGGGGGRGSFDFTGDVVKIQLCTIGPSE